MKKFFKILGSLLATLFALLFALVLYGTSPYAYFEAEKSASRPKLTAARAFEVSRYFFKYCKLKKGWPFPDPVVQIRRLEGEIDESDFSDGWDTPFQLINNFALNRVEIRSAGQDKIFETQDDLAWYVYVANCLKE